MKFNLETAEIFVPDGLPAEEALARTTHMAGSGMIWRQWDGDVQTQLTTHRTKQMWQPG